MISFNAVLSLVFLAIATILCALGLVTVEWLSLHSVDASAEVGSDGLIAWRRGLWEECRAPILPENSTQCEMTLMRDVSVTLHIIRVILCVGSICNVLAVICIVIWLFVNKCKHSVSWRSFCLFITALAGFLNILPSMAYGLGFAVTLEDQVKLRYQLDWSFYVSIVGSVLLSPANFFLCQYTHSVDDEDNLLYEKHQLRNQHEEDINTSYM